MKVRDMLRHFSEFPVKSFEAIMPGTAFILSPHPDDESLGCGGFIACAVENEQPPVVAIVSDGSASHPGSAIWPPKRLARLRQEESRDAAAVLGLPYDRLLFLGLQDAAVPTQGDSFDAVVQHLCEVVERYGCQTVLVPWRYDPHCDHEAVWIMGQKLKALLPRLTLLAYPVWGLTLPPEMEIDEMAPTGARLDIRKFLSRKRAAIQAHRSQRGLIVDDDPSGFVLPEHLLEKMLSPYEIFIAS
ncbi:PIG-L family deacetylase [Gluconobacter sp. Dm-62]|uniref:PIG-L deacetylase family protein n=1 Tax=Gluconobacter sp. Dm-62 TaxID=2799804 RepID=UPI001B8BD2F4|nr:PIG-L family deacetylase [Gluconobacter sp. Dm-62]MBS1103490.1 PIG-L family deacetylase [Gluconobacter sp. Dm-62]